jgi:hypothetical protein
MLGHPTDREFLGMIRANMINNCDITETAVKNAHTIFGPKLAGVRGLTVRRAPDPVRIKYMLTLQTILDRDVSQISVWYEYVLWAHLAKARC